MITHNNHVALKLSRLLPPIHLLELLIGFYMLKINCIIFLVKLEGWLMNWNMKLQCEMMLQRIRRHIRNILNYLVSAASSWPYNACFIYSLITSDSEEFCNSFHVVRKHVTKTSENKRLKQDYTFKIQMQEVFLFCVADIIHINLLSVYFICDTTCPRGALRRLFSLFLSKRTWWMFIVPQLFIFSCNFTSRWTTLQSNKKPLKTICIIQ